MRIRWTERASKDAIGIFDFIADQSLAYAESVYERILARPSQLERFPESGSMVPEYERPDIRELFVYAFRIIYRVEVDEVRVLTVIHAGRQSLPKPRGVMRTPGGALPVSVMGVDTPRGASSACASADGVMSTRLMLTKAWLE